jgi:group I intron endonuclease
MKEKLTCVVYCWENKLTNKKYIGSTVDLKHRFYSHLNYTTNKELNKDLNNLGISSFRFIILEFIDFEYNENKYLVKERLRDREQYYIDTMLKDENGKIIKEISYNISESSTKGIYERSESTKNKMSVSAKNKVLTEEHKKNISKNHASKKEDYVSYAKGKPMHKNAKIKLTEHCNSVKIKVYQFDLLGNYIAEYDSIREAAILNDFDNGNISKAVSGKSSSYMGYIWNNSLDVSNKIKKRKVIEMFDLKLNKIGEFNTAFEVETKMNIHHTNVSKAIKMGRATVGYYFQIKSN